MNSKDEAVGDAPHSMHEKLPSCPFCGQREILWTADGKFVYCPNLRCAIWDVRIKPEAWKNRTLPDGTRILPCYEDVNGEFVPRSALSKEGLAKLEDK